MQFAPSWILCLEEEEEEEELIQNRTRFLTRWTNTLSRNASLKPVSRRDPHRRSSSSGIHAQGLSCPRVARTLRGSPRHNLACHTVLPALNPFGSLVNDLSALCGRRETDRAVSNAYPTPDRPNSDYETVRLCCHLRVVTIVRSRPSEAPSV